MRTFLFWQSLWRAQNLIAIVLFFYFALKPPGIDSLTAPPWVLHFVGCALLITSMWLAWWPQIKMVTLLIIAIVFAIAAETAQSWIPSRTTDLFDYLMNIGGIISGASLCLCLARLRQGVFERTHKQN